MEVERSSGSIIQGASEREDPERTTRFSLRAFIAIKLIRFYKLFISPLLPGRCRFYPSCSEYALECFQTFSPGKALVKSIWRILRCNPFSEGYFDPVQPEAENHNH